MHVVGVRKKIAVKYYVGICTRPEHGAVCRQFAVVNARRSRRDYEG